MDEAGSLEVVSALVAVLSLGLGVLTLVYSRRDRREDLRLRREEETQLADVDRREREAVTHAQTPSEARLAYEEAQRARETVAARYAHPPERRPLFEPRMLLATSLGAWGVLLATTNGEGQADSNPANLGWGVGVAMIGLMLAVRGFQEARRVGSQAGELVWGAVVLVGAAGIIACLVSLDAYSTA